MKGHKDDEGTGAFLLCGKPERTGPGEEKIQGKGHQFIQTETWEVPSEYKGMPFYCETNQALE